jgi:hypothetical protein
MHGKKRHSDKLMHAERGVSVVFVVNQSTTASTSSYIK